MEGRWEDGVKTGVLELVLELGCQSAYLAFPRPWFNSQHHTRHSSSGLESCHMGDGDMMIISLRSRAGEIVQWVMHLLCKLGDLGLNPHGTHKSWVC